MAKQHIFLSYCRDNATEVKRLHGELLAAGENVWWDRDILPGQKWKLAIRQAMQDSYAVIFCFSSETEARLRSGMYPELRDAVDIYREYPPGSLFLIPVRLSECKIPATEIDATTMLEGIQWVDLFPPAQWPDGVERILRAVRAAPEHP